MRLLLSSVVLATCLAFSAPSEAKLKKDDYKALEQGTIGGVLISFLVDRHCNSQYFTVRNTKTGEISDKLFLSSKLKDSKSNFKQRFGLHPLEPGEYSFNGGECYAGGGNGYSKTYYRDIRPWFKPFKVKAGEISFLGTLTNDIVSYEVDGVLDFVPDFIIKPPQTDYRIYGLEDDMQSVLDAFDKKETKARPFIQKNLLEQRLEGDVVKNIIKESYMPEAGAKRVDGQVASEKLKRRLLYYYLTAQNSR